MKNCSAAECSQNNPQPLTNFYKDRNAKDGLASRCKTCIGIGVRVWRHTNLLKARKQYKKYRESERGRKLRNDQHRRFCQRNKERLREGGRIRFARRYAKKKELIGSHTPQEWAKLLDYYGNICLNCGIIAKETTLGKLTVDHIIPVNEYGPDDITNLQPLCLPCNGSKGIHTIDYRPSLPNWEVIRDSNNS